MMYFFLSADNYHCFIQSIELAQSIRFAMEGISSGAYHFFDFVLVITNNNTHHTHLRPILISYSSLNLILP